MMRSFGGGSSSVISCKLLHGCNFQIAHLMTQAARLDSIRRWNNPERPVREPWVTNG